MKVAVTTSGRTPGAALDTRFGRSAGFLVFDLDSESYEWIDNARNLQTGQGAGIQAAQQMVDKGVAALITGHCGPKAFHVLSAAGVHVFHCDVGTVMDAIDRFKAGTLDRVESADGQGHWM
jgi:predicted Fe-Mo cluster-binding NifX family protein